ncbi:MAG TPA: ubiquitin-like small modifier protein 1 [Anaerolineales bacterium]|jgi:molybdopterin converting factor small subunit
MPTLRIPTLMKYYVAGQTEVPLQGTSVVAILDDLVERYPAIKTQLFDSKGNLRRHINLFINDTNINDLTGLETAVKDGDRLILLPSISGGQ